MGDDCNRCRPIYPPSDRGYRFILTMVDLCMRYVEAIPLKYTAVEDVADALMSVFCQMGFPDIILSDNGSQFISYTMRSFTDMLSIAQTFSLRYHPQSNRVIENFHSTFKQMLAKVTAEFPQDWGQYLPTILFMYWEVLQESSGYSGNELIYGCSLRGYLSHLKDMWVQPDIPEYRA